MGKKTTSAKAGKKSQPAIKSGASKVKPLKRQKKIEKEAVTPQTVIPGSFRLAAISFGIIKHNWKPLGGIVLVYSLLNLLLSNTLNSLQAAISEIRFNFGEGSADNAPLSNAVNSFSSLVSGNSYSGSAMQSILIIVVSLSIIWALRQVLADKAVSVKESYYQAMTPFIPFVLVVLVILIQLLPLTLGTFALGIILTSVFAGDALVTILFSILFVLLAAWSLYLLCSSLMALYIVTLPNMQPRQSLRAAKNLVRLRRWQLMRRIVFLPLFILVAMGVAVIPLIMLYPSLAVAAFYALGALAILFGHTYLYSLYRSLL